MTKVNNREPIRRLAFRELKANRKMNFMLILSIVLTCILFTALTSIGGSLVNGTQQETMRQVGGDRMAGLKCVLPEDYEKVCRDRAVRDVVYRVTVGNAANEEFKNFFVEINYAGDEDAAKASFSEPTTGRLPESYDEIAVSTLVLDALGLPYELGTTVPIKLNVDGEISEHTFKLCGYWQGEKVAMAQLCWISEAFKDEYAPAPAESFYTQEHPSYAGYWQVDFNYANSWNIEGKTYALLSRLYGSSENAPDVGINWAYTTSSVDGGMIVSCIMMVLVIFAAGYLIIYNVFYINISANIRSYGLLKTIGTTSKQICRMVRMQAAVYCVIGIPFGLIIGILSGKILFKTIMVTINIYSAASYALSAKLLVMICLASTAFTFLTVMISCRKPCKIAGSVSPIEALRYNETNIHEKKRDKKTRTISPLSVARNNMLRSRKKTIVVVLSLTLSMVLVNTLFTVLKGVDMDKYVSAQIVGDFVVMHDKNSSYDSNFPHPHPPKLPKNTA
jgi:putative ABC transport system permease protein